MKCETKHETERRRPYDQYALQITKMATENFLLVSNFINVEASTNIAKLYS